MPFLLPLLEWVDLPAGQVVMGGHSYRVAPFKMARYPVTNAQYSAFVDDGGYKDAAYWDGLAQWTKAPRKSDWTEANAPKLQVCWFEAMAFCRWLTHRTGLGVRLPTEWEWQWAATGDTDWDYSYGPTFDASVSNTKESGIGRTSIVTDLTDVKTVFGTVDMAGNVLEWCLNEGVVPANLQIEGMENRALRGGSWSQPQDKASATFRSHRTPMTRQFNVGFRLAADI
jgi:formylglycine-generating enzyme required for sulfatase activity